MFKKIFGLGFSSSGKNAKDVHEYIDSLVKGGGNEFFVGYNPPYWYEKFGFEISPNMRFAEHEQVTDFETLKNLSERVHSHGIEIFGNLNFWYYTDETFPLIEKIYEDYQKVNLDGIICSSIAVLEFLKEKKYTGKINISTILSLYNKQSIRFILNNYKINKIILSRELTLKEIEELVSEFPDVLFEVFGEGDFCRYNNGLCFAEHKYSNKDICTVVANDLIIKKRFLPNFKKILLDKSIDDYDRSANFDNEYLDIYQEIDEITTNLELGIGDEISLKKELKNIIIISKNRIDLYYDAMKPINSTHNRNILIYLKALKILNLDEFKGLEKELKSSFKSGLKFYLEKSRNVGGESKLKALELQGFYGRTDNLNLYSYLFFGKFPNIETVKFPMRGRNYSNKIQIIDETTNQANINIKYIDRGISLERIHYDLTYLFGEKLRFRDLLKQFQ